MRLKSGSTVLVTLADGTTVEGRVRSHWRCWWIIWLDRATVHTPRGPQQADGWFFIPKRSVLMVQTEAGEE